MYHKLMPSEVQMCDTWMHLEMVSLFKCVFFLYLIEYLYFKAEIAGIFLLKWIEYV